MESICDVCGNPIGPEDGKVWTCAECGQTVCDECHVCENGTDRDICIQCEEEAG